MMQLQTDVGLIEIVNEPTYTFGSADNVRSYSVTKNFAGVFRPSSIHGLILDGVPIAVFGQAGGASGMHEHSIIYVDGLLYLAVGDSVVCVQPKPFFFKWVLRTDAATCFGVHFDERHRALISHGEVQISRFSNGGSLIWQVSGADIFTGPFSLHPEHIEATDWNGRIYRFCSNSGQLRY